MYNIINIWQRHINFLKIVMKNLIQNVQSHPTDSQELQTTEEKELVRYKDQLEALKNDSNYINFEDERKQLAGFYEENITRLQAKLDPKAARNIECKATVVSPNQSG